MKSYVILCVVSFLLPLFWIILEFLNKGMDRRAGYYGFLTGNCYAFDHVNYGILFTVFFFCTEWKNRCFGTSLLHGASRRKVFFAKVIAFVEGMMLLHFIYLTGWTLFSTLFYGFGKEITLKLFFGMFYRMLVGILGIITISSVLVLTVTIGKNALITLLLTYCVYTPLAFMKNNYWFYDWIEKPLPYLRYTYVFQIYSTYEDARGDVYQICTELGDALGAKYMSFHPETYLTVCCLTIIGCLASAYFIFHKTELR